MFLELIERLSQVNQQLENALKGFQDLNIIKNLTNLAKAFNKSLADIKENSQSTKLRAILQEEIKYIGKLIESRIGLIGASTADYQEKAKAIEMLGNIYDCYSDLINSFQIPSLSQFVARWQEDRLFLEQQIICKEPTIKKGFENLLIKINEMALCASLRIPNECLISYVVDKTNDEEKWVQIFLSNLMAHLRLAGVNVLPDVIDNLRVGSIYQEMDRIKYSDCVIVVGTESLFQQHRFEVNSICNEFILIGQNRIHHQGVTLPILLSGCFEKTLPPYFMRYSNIIDWREYSYLENLKKLIANIYGIAPDYPSYQQKWAAFGNQYPSLIKGFSKEAVREQLAIKEKLKVQEKELDNQQVIQWFNEESFNRVNQSKVSNENQGSLLTWEKLIECVKTKYILMSKFKTVFGEAQEIDHYYANLAIVEEHEQKGKEKLLAERTYYQDVQTDKKFNKKQKLSKQKLEREALLNSYEEIYATKTSIAPWDIHKSQEGNAIYRQLILGRAGIGKSTFCQYLAYQWAKEEWWKDEPFKLLVWIPLRQLLNEKIYPKGGKKTITLGKIFFEQFKKQLQAELPVVQNTKWIEALDSLIKGHATEILYVLDGFDEVANVCQLDSRRATRQTEIIDELLEQKRILITSRPYYIDNYLNTQAIRIDRRLENIGFVDKNIQDYVQHYSWKAPEQQETLQFLLNNNHLIKGIAHIPINLAWICRYWSMQTLKEHHISMTDLCEGLLGDLLYEYLGRQSGKGYIDFVSLTTSSILNNKKLQPILQFLEELAFLQMQKESLIVSKKKIANLLEEFESRVKVNEWQGFKSVLGTGLLVSLDSQEKRFEDRREHYFIHLTFQEFLAARYIARLFKKNDGLSREMDLLKRKKLIQKIGVQSLNLFIQDHKYDLRYETVWWFVASLLRKSKKGIEKFFNSLLSAPRSFSGWYDVLLWIKCLEESKLTDNLNEELKNNLVKEIRKMAQAALDGNVCISGKEYSKTFFKYLYSSPMIYKALGILQTQEAIKDTLNILKWHANLPVNVLKIIVSLLRDKTVKSSALFALGQQSNLPISVLEEMVGLLKDEDENVRSLVPSVLGQQPNLPVSVLKKIVSLLHDKEGYVKSSALGVLVDQSSLSPELLRKVVSLLSDKERNVRNSAKEVLEKQSSLSPELLREVVNLLSDKEWNVRSSAQVVLANQSSLSPELLNIVVSLLSDKEGYIKSSALRILANQSSLSSELLREVVSMLSDEEGYVRSSALGVLAKQSNLLPELLNIVVSMLSDKERNVRISALRVLANQSSLSPELLREVVSLLSDKERDVRMSAQAVLAAQSSLSPELLREVVSLLRDKKWDVRMSAQAVLAAQSSLSPELLREVVSLLSDEEGDVRSSAQAVLADQPSLSPKLLREVVSLLSDKEGGVRNSALGVLEKQSSLSLKLLNIVVSLLSDKEGYVRISALRVLVNQSSLSPELSRDMARLLRDKERYIRSSAIGVLANQSSLSPELLKEVVNLLSDKERDVKSSAQAILAAQSSLSPELLREVVSLLSDKERDVRSSALGVLANQSSLSPELLRNAVSLLCYKEGDVRSSALRVLANQLSLLPELLREVASLLSDKERDVKISALRVLANQSSLSPELLKEVVNLLSDKEGEVRSSVLRVLANQSSLSPELLREFFRLFSDKEGEVRSSVLRVLANQSSLSPELLREVVSLLRDKEGYVRSSAKEVLANQSSLSPELLREIVSMLSDKERDIRNSALGVLANQSSLSPELLREVFSLLSDEEGYVRSSAQEILGKQSSLSPGLLREVVSMLSDKERDIRNSALGVLANQSSLSPELLNIVVSMLSDKERDIRSSALRVLAKQSSLLPELLDTVVSMLRDKDWDTLRAAQSVLGQQLNLSDSVLNEKVNLLNDKKKYVRISALSALGQQPNLSDSVLDEIVKLLSNIDWDVRCSVLSVLGKQKNLPVNVLEKMVNLLEDENWYTRSAALSILYKQINLPVKILSKVINLIADKNQVYKLNTKQINFINQQLVPILDSPELQSQLSLASTLLSDIILQNTFSSKNVVYFENNQSLIIRLGQQVKHIAIKDKNEFIQVFIERHKHWLNNHKIDCLLNQVVVQLSMISLEESKVEIEGNKIEIK